jgi:hypothetical protein
VIQASGGPHGSGPGAQADKREAPAGPLEALAQLVSGGVVRH